MSNLYKIIFFIFVTQFSFGEIFVKIHEPIRFQNHNTRSISSNTLVGEGILEIYTDDEKEDLGKKIIFRFPENGTMSNKKKNIKVEKYSLEIKEKEFILTNKRELIKVFAYINKNNFSNYNETELIEGEYSGTIPIILSVYKIK